MPDPFQNLSDAGDDLIEIIVTALENRGADPQMLPIVDAYLDRLSPPDGGRIIDIGAGTGAITRRIAARFPAASVVGIEPAPQLVAAAERLRDGIGNLTFEVGSGEDLAVAADSVDVAVLHTVLSHVPKPERLVAEAWRVVKPGGRLVVCDADFSKISMSLVDGDPLGACTTTFMREFVTDPWLTARLRGMVSRAGFRIEDFSIDNRLDLGEGLGGGLTWVRMSSKHLVDHGIIGEPMAAALLAEYERRVEARTIYGFLPFATLIAEKPPVHGG